MTIAIYPGTFDPITTGHVSVIREAARLSESAPASLTVMTSVGVTRAGRGTP